MRARAFYEGPIVILSARDMEMEKIEALDLGADDYVEKPFHVGELLARLRVAMRHALNRAGAPAVGACGGASRSTSSSGWSPATASRFASRRASMTSWPASLRAAAR